MTVGQLKAYLEEHKVPDDTVIYETRYFGLVPVEALEYHSDYSYESCGPSDNMDVFEIRYGKVLFIR